jgi:hypothetical protein
MDEGRQFLWTCPTCSREVPQRHIQRVAGLHRAWWRCPATDHIEVYTELVGGEVIDGGVFGSPGQARGSWRKRRA